MDIIWIDMLILVKTVARTESGGFVDYTGETIPF